MALCDCVGLVGVKYDSLEGGGGINGLRTNEVGLGSAIGASGASPVLLNAAIRSRNEEDFSGLD